MKITIELDGLNRSELGQLAFALNDAYFNFGDCEDCGCDKCSKIRVCHTLRNITAQVLNAYEDACEEVQE